MRPLQREVDLNDWATQGGGSLAVCLILAHGFANLGKNKPSIITICS